MESSPFEIIEHTLPAQYIREYHCGVTSDANRPKLAVKEYRPLSGPISENAMTIIATHANGICKETYEALWEELSNCWPGQVRAIWFADCAHQGASASLNDAILSDDRTEVLNLPRHMLTVLSSLVRSFSRLASTYQPLR